MPTVELTLEVPIDERHADMLEEIDDLVGENRDATDLLSQNLVDKEFTLRLQQMIYGALYQLELQEEQQQQMKAQARRAGLELADEPEPPELVEAEDPEVDYDDVGPDQEG